MLRLFVLVAISASCYGHVVKRQAECHAKYTAMTSTHSQCLTGTGSNFVSSDEPDATEIAEILAAHNVHRSDVNATNMMKMKWNSDIASSAQKRANQCVFSHDSSTERIEPGKFGVGQNIAAGSIGYFASWTEVVDYWASEITVFDKVSRISSSASGHYSQVVWAKSSMVGCGKTTCGNMEFYFCNYAPAGNMMNTPAYNVGTVCSECGTERCTDNLCDCGMDNSWNTCLNDGTLDLASCTCACGQSFYDSSKQCELTTCSNNPGTCSFWQSNFCQIYSNVPTMCPTLCSVCPYAASDYE